MRTSNEIPRLISTADPADLTLVNGECGIPYFIANAFGVFHISWKSVFQSYIKYVYYIVVLPVLGRVTVREPSINTTLFRSFE